MCRVVNLWACVQGRIHQIEYAMEAVKQGSATVGLKSRSHAVLVALKVLRYTTPEASVRSRRALAVIAVTWTGFLSVIQEPW